MLADDVVSNLLAGAGGEGGRLRGAFTASNVDLYNGSTTNGDGTGCKGSQLLAWIGDRLVSVGRGVVKLGN